MTSDLMTNQSEDVQTHKGLIWHAKRFIHGLNWLSPTASLTSKGGREFGRGIEASLKEVASGSIMRLQLRKRDAAVVMSVAQYEDMVRMKVFYEELIEQVKEKEIMEEADEYEALYQRITSAQSRDATDALFSATSESLRETYQPGRTESQ